MASRGPGLARVRPCKGMALQEYGLAGIWPRRDMTLQGYYLAGVWPCRSMACRGMTLQLCDLTMVQSTLDNRNYLRCKIVVSGIERFRL